MVVAVLHPSSLRLADPAPARSRAAHLPPGARAVAELAGPGCRWPMGEVEQEEFRFCGAPRSRGSYCAGHRRIAYRGAGR